MKQVSDWVLSETTFSSDKVGERETLFSLANGYFGYRGFFTERTPVHHAGVFVNGFYEQSKICYGEGAYGFPEYNQRMIDLPDVRYLSLRCNGEDFSMDEGVLLSYHRVLDMRKGVVIRTVGWESPSGVQFTLTWEHLISYRLRNMGALRFTVEFAGEAEVEVLSAVMMPAVKKAADPNDPRTSGEEEKESLCRVNSHAMEIGSYRCIDSLYRTASSGLSLRCGYALRAQKGEVQDQEEGILTIPLSPGKTVIEKLYFYTSGKSSCESDTVNRYEYVVHAGIAAGFERLFKMQEEELDAFWRVSSIEIDGDPEYQKALRFNMFQLFQSAGRDGRTSLAAKGLSGNGYEGHYFWDTEIYGMPFYTMVKPEIARKLLEYRISILDSARKRAGELSEKGALFPWRTINGDEVSAYFPAGTAQYHINGDIAYSLIQYVELTGDVSIMADGGAELLFETARLWLSLGFFNARRNGMFCINEVTGPDEYTALVNNNFYTNALASFHMRAAAHWFDRLMTKNPEALSKVRRAIALEEDEVLQWKAAAEHIFLPYDHELGINLQDDAFLQREKWDFANTPKEQYPLLLHFHPLVIYRHQVLKQADTILTHLLFPDMYPAEQKRRDFDYYEALTTGDSSLSACIQGVLALELGHQETGRKHARSAAFVDLHNMQGNTRDGLHVASMAGSWLLTLYGLAGLRVGGGKISFYPRTLPEGWKSLKFKIALQGGVLSVHATNEESEYRYEGKKSLEIYHRNRTLSVGDIPVTVSAKPEFWGAVFDLDGVITSTDMLHYRAWKHLADELGCRFDHEINQRLRGVSRRESLEIILEVNHAALSEEEIAESMEKKNTWYRESLSQLSGEDLLPGTADLLNELKEQGIKIALASASRNAPYILQRLGLENSFDYIVPVESLIKGKPDPEIFMKGARGLGLEPDECVGFEDAPPGVEGIRAAGMKSVAVSDSVSDAAADIHCTDLREITAAMLKGLF